MDPGIDGWVVLRRGSRSILSCPIRAPFLMAWVLLLTLLMITWISPQQRNTKCSAITVHFLVNTHMPIFAAMRSIAPLLRLNL